MIINIVNNKGGTGKTTTCISLGAALAREGKRVLIIDMDPQASASLSLGVPFAELAPSTADILFDGRTLTDTVRPMTDSGLDLVTAEMALASADLMLADRADRAQRLREALDTVRDDYDFILCDCPPSMSMLVINAMVAADHYLIPVTPDYLALEGLLSLMQAVDQARRGLGIDCTLLGILFTQVQNGLNLTTKVTGLVRERWGKLVFDTEIRRDVRLAEAPSMNRTIYGYTPNSRGARAYTRLAQEVMRRTAAAGVQPPAA
ncbi:MAG: ParA family protein [Deltaproteobacteria bacterium]|nr:ParA family protein [Candidatus Anaeroferrophillacea bacterium]